MKRALWLFVALSSLAACGPTASCKCSEGSACVFVGVAATPVCRSGCAASDAGAACPSGTACGCGASCQGCKDCVAVCL